MDGLEDRVKLCSDENMSLQKRIRLLETENKSLLSQLKRLQSILTGQGGNQASPTVAAITAASTTAGTNTNTNSKEGLSTTSNTAQPATCLLVLMLSFALFLLPNLRPDSNKSLTDGRTNSAASQMAQSMMKMPPFAGKKTCTANKSVSEGFIYFVCLLCCFLPSVHRSFQSIVTRYIGFGC